jgi:hypothetical protein
MDAEAERDVAQNLVFELRGQIAKYEATLESILNQVTSLRSDLTEDGRTPLHDRVSEFQATVVAAVEELRQDQRNVTQDAARTQTASTMNFRELGDSLDGHDDKDCYERDEALGLLDEMDETDMRTLMQEAAVDDEMVQRTVESDGVADTDDLLVAVEVEAPAAAPSTDRDSRVDDHEVVEASWADDDECEETSAPTCEPGGSVPLAKAAAAKVVHMPDLPASGIGKGSGDELDQGKPTKKQTVDEEAQQPKVALGNQSGGQFTMSADHSVEAVGEQSHTDTYDPDKKAVLAQIRHGARVKVWWTKLDYRLRDAIDGFERGEVIKVDQPELAKRSTGLTVRFRVLYDDGDKRWHVLEDMHVELEHDRDGHQQQSLEDTKASEHVTSRRDTRHCAAPAVTSTKELADEPSMPGTSKHHSEGAKPEPSLPGTSKHHSEGAKPDDRLDQLVPGTKVRAQYMASVPKEKRRKKPGVNKFWDGVIRAVDEDGTYTVLYNDGVVESGVLREYIHVIVDDAGIDDVDDEKEAEVDEVDNDEDELSRSNELLPQKPRCGSLHADIFEALCDGVTQRDDIAEHVWENGVSSTRGAKEKNKDVLRTDVVTCLGREPRRERPLWNQRDDHYRLTNEGKRLRDHLNDRTGESPAKRSKQCQSA